MATAVNQTAVAKKMPSRRQLASTCGDVTCQQQVSRQHCFLAYSQDHGAIYVDFMAIKAQPNTRHSIQAEAISHVLATSATQNELKLTFLEDMSCGFSL